MSRTDSELVADALDHLTVLKRHRERADLADETIVDAVENDVPEFERRIRCALAENDPG